VKTGHSYFAKNRTFHFGLTYIKYLDGQDVCRYVITLGGQYLKYGDNLAAPRKDFRLYSTQRILVRQIPAKPPYCIHACLVEETILNDRNSMNVINIREKSEDVLEVLNARLVSWWFLHKFGKMQQETFPQFKVNELADFPLPKNGGKHGGSGNRTFAQRREDLMSIVAAQKQVLGIAPAGAALAVSRATYYRRQRPKTLVPTTCRKIPHPACRSPSRMCVLHSDGEALP
jgi:hypothetical protein